MAAVSREADERPVRFFRPEMSHSRHATPVESLTRIKACPAPKDNIGEPNSAAQSDVESKGESHDNDQTWLHWFACAIGLDGNRRRVAYGSPGFGRPRPLKRRRSRRKRYRYKDRHR